MSVPENLPIGQIVYLAGPSSSGKSTSSKELVIAQGWIHIERDKILVQCCIKHLEKNFAKDLEFIKQHLAPNATAEDLFNAICQAIKPDVKPDNLQKYEQACKRMQAFLNSHGKETNREIVIQMFDEAVKAAKLGKNVIIDDVPFINEHYKVSTPDLVLSEENAKKIWKYKGVVIDQRVKHVKIDTLMRNVFLRSQDPKDRRDPLGVLYQYSDLFKAVKLNLSGKGQPPSFKIKTSDLKQWIEKAVKLNFMAFDGVDHFVYDSLRELPGAGDKLTLKDRVIAFVDDNKMMQKYVEKVKKAADSENPIEKKQGIDLLFQWIELKDTIKKATREIFQNMRVPSGASEVNLDYHSYLGAHVNVVQDK